MKNNSGNNFDSSSSQNRKKLNIPDFRFKKAIVDILFPERKKEGIYTIWEDDLPVIEKVKKLNISFRNIDSLEGIGYFKSLLVLECYANDIREIDISRNEKLLKLFCGRNKIENLKLNGKLKSLSCPDNKLKNLDLTGEKYLQYIYCDHNELESIDLYKMVELNMLKCSHNKLKRLNLTFLPTLNHLECYNNEIEKLDVSYNVFLEVLYAQNNRLKSMDISGNPFMNMFDVRGNEITDLNISESLDLTRLFCSENRIAGLYIKEHKSLVTGYVSLDDQKRDIRIQPLRDGYFIDMKKLVGEENIKYLKEFSEGDYNKETGILMFKEKPTEIDYIFYTWNIARTRMKVKLNVLD